VRSAIRLVWICVVDTRARQRNPRCSRAGVEFRTPCSARQRRQWCVLQISVRFVHSDQVDSLREWFRQLETTRRPEALATLIDETVTHEQAILVTETDPPMLVYAMEVADPVQSRRSADSGKHSIDAEHRAITRAAVAGAPTQEVILDLLVGNGDR
jgi:hypothetical protein